MAGTGTPRESPAAPSPRGARRSPAQAVRQAVDDVAPSAGGKRGVERCVGEATQVVMKPGKAPKPSGECRVRGGARANH
jgi:hypothetical protein